MDDTFRGGPFLLIAGRANRPLALEIGRILGENPESATIRDFADGEIFLVSGRQFCYNSMQHFRL